MIPAQPGEKFPQGNPEIGMECLVDGLEDGIPQDAAENPVTIQLVAMSDI